MATIGICTKRLSIDFITIDDAPFFVSLVNTTDWLRFIGDRGVTDIESAASYLKNGFLKCYEDNGFGYYIVRKTSDQEAVGICGFLKKPDLEYPDFGFALLPEYYGHGYAFEACKAVLSFGIKEFGFRFLDAVTTDDNERSAHLLIKLGFEKVGVVANQDEAKELMLYRYDCSGTCNE